MVASTCQIKPQLVLMYLLTFACLLVRSLVACVHATFFATALGLGLERKLPARTTSSDSC